MTNIVQFPNKKKPPKSNIMKVQYSLGTDNVLTPAFTTNFEEDIGDQFITDWHDFIKFFISPGDDLTARMQLFMDNCMLLGEHGVRVLETNPAEFDKIEQELNKLIAKASI